MPSQQITLAYHQRNQLFAQQLEKCFAKTNLVFEHLICREGLFSPTYNQILSKEQNKILLLVSDNYLRSEAAMSEGLSTLQNLIKNNQITPLIIDGVDENNKPVVTEFERIGQIIKYMNFWQDNYLELRQEGRKRGEIDDDLEIRTRKVREVSTNVGEYLRYLRDQKPAFIAPVLADKFETFKIFFGITGEVETGFLETAIYQPAENSNGVSNERQKDIPSANSPEMEKKQVVEPSAAASSLSNTKPIIEEVVENESEIPSENKVKESTELPNHPKEIEADLFENTELEQGEIDINLSDIPGIDQIIARNKNQANNFTEEFIAEEPPFPTEINMPAEIEEKENLQDPKPNIEEINIPEPIEEAAKEFNETPAINPVSEPIEMKTNNQKFSIPGFLDDLIETDKEVIKEIKIDEELENVSNLLHEKNYIAAKNKLEQLSNQFPRDARIWSDLGKIAENQKDYILASTQYSRALELDPTLPGLDYKVGLIISNYYPDQTEKALQYFTTAIAKDPTHINALYQKGILLNEKKKNSQDAIPLFKQVLSLAPNHEFANYDLALIYYDLKDRESALDFYTRAFKNNPELQTPENDLAFGFMLDDAPSSANNLEAAQSIKTNVVEKPKLEEKAIQPSVDQTILITGATSGIGKATALEFAKAGYRVILAGRRTDRLEAYSKELKSINANIQFLTFDVRDIKSAQTALNTLEGKFSEINLLINNAGLASGLDFIHEGNLKDWNTMIDTNIKGVLYMTRLLTPHMVKRGSGHIINICSTAGHEVYPKGNVYCATKHAVDALTKGMRMDLHKHGIKVSQVSPAHVEETEFAKVRFHGDEEKAKIYEEFNPLKSSDVAKTIFFIATQPDHVNIQDVLMMGTQQASSLVVDKSGRKYD